MSQNDRRMAFVMPIFTHDGVGPAFNAADPEAALSVIERFRGACLAGLNGEMAIDAAMGAVQLKHGETPPPLTGVQLISEARYAAEQLGHDRQAGALGLSDHLDEIIGMNYNIAFDELVDGVSESNSWSNDQLIEVAELCAAIIDARQRECDAAEEPPRLEDVDG